MEVEISKDIDAPPEVVWHYLVTSPHREGVGVEADAIIRIG
jgi:hypothetical protein